MVIWLEDTTLMTPYLTAAHSLAGFCLMRLWLLDSLYLPHVPLLALSGALQS